MAGAPPPQPECHLKSYDFAAVSYYSRFSLSSHLSAPSIRFIIHVCSGPDRPGSYSRIASTMGSATVDIDTCLRPELNLCHDDCFGLVLRLCGHPLCCGMQGDPQCSTFSSLLSLPGGPRPVRGCEGRDLLGLPGLDAKTMEKVRRDTPLAVRVAKLAEKMH